jgi:hypothetical protein
MNDFERNNVVPIRFQSFDELQRSEREIFVKHHDGWHAAFHRFDMVDAALKGDDAALAKCAGPDEVPMAKVEASRLRSKHGDAANIYALQSLVKTLREINETRDRQLYGHTAVAKRSLRFASANPDRFYGPAASLLPSA